MNPNSINIAWTLIATVAFCFTAFLIGEDEKWYKAVMYGVSLKRVALYGPRWWIVIGFLVADVLFSFAWLGFTLIGLVSISLPPAVSEERRTAQEITGWVLIGLELDMASVQGWWWFVRRKLRSLVRITEPLTDQKGATI